MSCINRHIANDFRVANVTRPDFYYYTKDHLGSIRSVVRSGNNGPAEVQRAAYYPFGGVIPEFTVNLGTQDHLYNGKELDTSNNLWWYDYVTRPYDPTKGQFTNYDQHCESYNNTNPLTYCGNNPICRIDPTGCDSVFYSGEGIELKRIQCQDSYNFVLKTPKTTDEFYGKNNNAQKGKSSPISQENYVETAKKIMDGNITGSHMNNVIRIGNDSQMEAMIAAIGDDGTGGASEANNREYSGIFTKKGVKSNIPSSVGDLSTGANLVTKASRIDWHSHPSGSKKVQGGTAMWMQPPSKQDINTAHKLEYVVGMGASTIFIYNNTGIVATLPLYVFK